MITVKLVGLERVKRLLDPKKVDRAVVSAINRVAASTKTEASKVVRNEKGWKIKKRDFDKKISLTKARRGKAVAVISPKRISVASGKAASKDSFALPYFGAREIRKTSTGVVTYRRSSQGGLSSRKQKRTRQGGGVTVQVQKGGKKARYPHAFMAQMKSGHIGVFRRLPGTRMKSNSKKEQINEVRVISVATMFKGIRRRLVKHAQGRWRKEFKAQLRHQFRK